jgi:predicted transcriptional regulator
MRALVERTAWSYRRIGAELGIAPATVWRYAVDGQWQRPPGAALPARIARHRDKTTEKLWKLAARHASALEEQDPEVTRQSLQPLASLTRALGTLSPKPGAGPAPEEELRPEKPPRSLNELRDELVAHLERIDREEGMYWERFDWNFKDGGGI